MMRLSATNPTYQTQHSLTLADLKPDTTYYYRVESRDQQGRSISSVIHSFKPASR